MSMEYLLICDQHTLKAKLKLSMYMHCVNSLVQVELMFSAG